MSSRSPRVSIRFDDAGADASGGGGMPDSSASHGRGDDPLTVSALTRRIKTLLEGTLGRVSVAGEIGNFTRAASGHLYLSLKDSGAVLDAVMWRGNAARLVFSPKEGDSVVARGTLSVYEPRGRYQMVIDTLQPAGQGSLQQQFEQMVERLRAEGLFDPSHKKDLPETIRTVGVATSPTGAAIRDILKVLEKRAPSIRVVVSPCLVQGPTAPEEIANAVRRLDAWGGCDVIIVGRGGGSAEDLWAFNDERVVRAVFALKTPVVSAVGHEVDISICDLVADVRAATPTEAAQLVSPDLRHVKERAVRLRRALAAALTARLRDDERRVAELLRSPVLRNPMEMVERRFQHVDDLNGQLTRRMETRLEQAEHRIALHAARLEGLSPLGVLARGYSVTQTADGRVLRSVSAVQPGMTLSTRFPDGSVTSTVTGIAGA